MESSIREAMEADSGNSTLQDELASFPASQSEYFNLYRSAFAAEPVPCQALPLLLPPPDPDLLHPLRRGHLQEGGRGAPRIRRGAAGSEKIFIYFLGGLVLVYCFLQEIVALCAVQFLSIATLLPMMAELYRFGGIKANE